MRLGPKEKEILKKLIPGEFVPPSVYLGEYGSCTSSSPIAQTLQRITRIKGLAQFRWETQSPAERKKANETLRPGREASEYNAALIPTQKGEELIKALTM